MFRHAPGAAAFAFAFGLGGAAPAQIGGPSDWVRECADGRCTVSARMVEPLADTRFATVVIGFDEGGGAPALAIAAPLGIAVQPGVRLVIDRERALDLPVVVCLPDGCRAARPLEEAEIRAIAAAETLEVRYFGGGEGRQVGADLSTTGLAGRLREYAP